MHRAKTGFICSLFAIVMAFSSCAPQPFIAPPSQPSLNPFAIDTLIAQTAAVAQKETLTALPPTDTPALPTDTPLPSKTPTRTPTSTATVLFLFPTETLDTSILLEPTTSLGDNGGSAGEEEGDDDDGRSKYKDKEWACIVLSKSPAESTIISPKSRFKVRWIIENTGTKTWPKKGVDVVFLSGARVHDRAYYDIPKTVYPGGTVMIELTFTAPPTRKTYNAYWTLRVGNRNFCTMPITFNVNVH
jgi:hypothetical protein